VRHQEAAGKLLFTEKGVAVGVAQAEALPAQALPGGALLAAS
jgi:hypothetical protein